MSTEMSARVHVLAPDGYEDAMTTPAKWPPHRPSNEAERDQLDVAAGEGDAYRRALEAMDAESGAKIREAGPYVVAFVQEEAEGMYALEDGSLTWREAAGEADGHFEIAVADAADGRFVPGLEVSLTLVDDGREVMSMPLPFLWHPFLHHYGGNVKLPGAGPYTVRAVIEPPRYMRHDPVNGKRYGERVEVEFPDQRFEPGRKPSPHARPRGADAPYATA
jgi:uncharacterized protein involved in high-affinity Fe2+ transport